MFTLTIFEILLFRGGSILSSTQRGTGNARVNQLNNIPIMYPAATTISYVQDQYDASITA